ncbi:AAA domain-containing protein [bacterium]|nr:AAA domain-containing protein [bacterium]
MADEVKLEGGTYEILRTRLNGHAAELRARVERLNQARKNAFGKIEQALLASQRITTANNCTPRDLICLGHRFLFGYNVQFGLKATVNVEDVFATYEEGEGGFVESKASLLEDVRFREDFASLYKYYKNTTFAQFHLSGPHLFMVFQIGRAVTDVKTFKWLVQDGELTYIDNRSDHEFKFPPQHDFEWKRTHRDMRREGRFAHISIEDRVFIETTGGDLTVKIEDNTATGQGIYSEPVDHKEQTLDDAEFFYAIVGPMILLRIRPYQEKNYRYLVYNEKLKTVARVDAMERACILLPDSQGLIFPNGYCLQTGELKIFDHNPEGMIFERRLAAPNGEDYLYSFHNRETGVYTLLSYNLIEQQVATPLHSNGYSLFDDGRMVVLRADAEPTRHHMVQTWQTPFVASALSVPQAADSPLVKVGNKEVVRVMAECAELMKLCERGEAYELVYTDIARTASGMIDSYFWLGEAFAENLAEVLQLIRGTANAAVDEFRKVTALRRTAREAVGTFTTRAAELMQSVQPAYLNSIDDFVKGMADYRALRGQVGTLREMRYADLEQIGKVEQQLVERMDLLANGTVDHLLKPESLVPYEQRLAKLAADVAAATKGVEVGEHAKAIEETAKGLDLLIDVVSNLKIEDPTRSAAIIDRISTVYAGVNQQREATKARRKELGGAEAIVEFGAQLKLLGQSVVNFLDVADTPARVEEYLNKLLVQVESLESRFSDYDEFISQLADKREEIQSAFESRKLALIEARNKKASTLQSSANRILSGIRNKAESLKEIEELHSYFASDLMVEKVRDIVRQLVELGDPVKGDEIGGRLKSTLENAVRQLKDRKELFEDGQNVIKLGRHSFSVNTQPLDLTILQRDGGLFFHLTGTNFFDQITDPEILALRDVWDLEVRSESPSLYRAEFLAFSFHEANPHLLPGSEEELLAQVQAFMAPRYQEGYLKGVHDLDAARIYQVLKAALSDAGLLRWSSESRSAALLAWSWLVEPDRREATARRCAAAGALREVFPAADFSSEIESLKELLLGAYRGIDIYTDATVDAAARYLFDQLGSSEVFPLDGHAADLAARFESYLTESMHRGRFEKALKAWEADAVERFCLVRRWVGGFLETLGEERDTFAPHLDEAVVHLLKPTVSRAISRVETRGFIAGMRGNHPLIAQGNLPFDLPAFLSRLAEHQATVLPRLERFQTLKRELVEKYRKSLRLDEFKPRVLTSFVRNRLIDSVYLPRIGENFAKQMGTVGATKRTDLMGMLLLVSPPGYGKTTIMEYLAHRLGLVFMKINGPALGHRVLSLDPTEAPNAGAREELNKLNLAFEMGDNVMIYVDDIQHCHPEFLQKFISLCDGQRKIEGVFRGTAKTYDLRGRKVCVVMAGNPYTESGDKFQIPDMLANRADTYNLGDIIGDSREAFELSYIENSLTSNPILGRLSTRSQKDLYTFVRLVDTGSREGLDFEGSYSAEEQTEIVAVLRRMREIQSVILKVNLEYIRSAAQEDAYRTEPPFKLQGSYRNMNKLAEKVLPIMDDKELRTLLMAHYESEAQTLTGSAEFNLARFRELQGWATAEDRARLEAIRETFQRNMKLRGMSETDPMSQLLAEVGDMQRAFSKIGGSVERVYTALDTARGAISEGLAATGQGVSALRGELDGIGSGLRGLAAIDKTNQVLAKGFSEMATLRAAPSGGAPDAAKLDEFLGKLRVVLSAAARPIIVRSEVPSTRQETGLEVSAERRGAFASDAELHAWLSEEGWGIGELGGGRLELYDNSDTRLVISMMPEALYFQSEAGQVPPAVARHIYRELLALNTQILPLSIGLDRGSAEMHRLLVLESRDRSIMSREELSTILRAFHSAVQATRSLVRDLLAAPPPPE